MNSDRIVAYVLPRYVSRLSSIENEDYTMGLIRHPLNGVEVDLQRLKKIKSTVLYACI